LIIIKEKEKKREAGLQGAAVGSRPKQVRAKWLEFGILSESVTVPSRRRVKLNKRFSSHGAAAAVHIEQLMGEIRRDYMCAGTFLPRVGAAVVEVARLGSLNHRP